ncbi:MAG: molybdopterin-dependent oxidoreductase [Pseudomonadota bacterium]
MDDPGSSVDLAMSPDGKAATVKTTCPYCGVGCGVLATPAADGSVTIKGDPHHPANFGRLCSKGAALAETLGLEGRLLHPEIGGARATWDEALDLVLERFRQAIDQHGPDSVAFYVSGQILTEDYYVANKLMKGFIGSGNIDTNSRLCMASAVAAHKRAFGTDTVPCDYTDLEDAELVLIVGSNLAWCHPVIYQRLLAAKAENPSMRVVVIDPRRTATAEIADLHLAIRPGRDGFLLTWLLAELDRLGCRDEAFIREHTEGFEATLDSAREHAGDMEDIAAETGLDAEDLLRLRDWIIPRERMVTLFSQGINQSSSGTDKGNAIINLHLLTGRIGKPGMGPFSVTGQPNAMGGREVGGLANQLAAHVDFSDAERVDLVHDFWRSTSPATKSGLKAVDLFAAARNGKIKALLIMATNPLVSLPDVDAIKENLPDDLFVVVVDCIRETPTTAIADVLLPAAAWGEKDGTVTNSERRISRQRPFLPTPGEARPDWWILTELGKRLGYAAAFDFETPAQIFREHADLVRAVDRDLDVGDPASLSDHVYESWEPTAWPVGSRKRLFADGRFFTENGKARFIAIEPRAPEAVPDWRYPFVLNTGRYRDHWHTLTRTSRSVTLSRHRIEPLAEINPKDAEALGLGDNDLVRLTSPAGQAIMPLAFEEGVPAGQIFAPMHWNGADNDKAVINRLVMPATDPISGQPESKAAVLRVEPAPHRHRGFALTRTDIVFADCLYASRSRIAGGWLHRLAIDAGVDDWQGWLASRLGEGPGERQWLAYHDEARDQHRIAALDDGVLSAVLFIGDGPATDWLSQQFAARELDDHARKALLLGTAPGADPGPLVCACFGVGRNIIARAIDDHGLCSTDLVGAALKAGTNCGSCLPELRSLIRSAAICQNRAACQPATPSATSDRDLIDAEV